MKKMQCIIINSSDTFEYRVDMLREVLLEKNYDVTVIASDYRHIEKEYRYDNKAGFRRIHTLSYSKNISIKRLLSHYKFSLDSYKRIKQIQCNLLYVVIPPNSQAMLIKKYLKRNSTVKVIADIIDLWPESLPTRCTDKFPFTIWASIRNRNLKYADFIITECDLYQNKLDKWLTNKNVRTVYWSHKTTLKNINREPTLDNNYWTLCYLGSINNIIDIAQIGNVIKFFSKTKAVVLKIIGDGEKREELMKTARLEGAEVIYYGKIYDRQKKQEIFNTCHYGLNIMKDCISVGLSMKSIDYLEAGLPIINNMTGDLKDIIRKERCGLNMEELVQIPKYSLDFRDNAKNFFERECSNEAFKQKMKEIIEDCKKEKENDDI